MGVGAWIALGWELVKLVPDVVKWVKSHPFKNKEAAKEFPKELKRTVFSDSSPGIKREE